jgi:hypothetical protein
VLIPARSAGKDVRLARGVEGRLGVGDSVGTPRLDTHVHVGHTVDSNPCQYRAVHVWIFLAILLIIRLSGIRNQQVSGSSPLAGFSLYLNNLACLLAGIFWASKERGVTPG